MIEALRRDIETLAPAMVLFVLARVLNRANLDGLGGDDVVCGWLAAHRYRVASVTLARRSAVANSCVLYGGVVLGLLGTALVQGVVAAIGSLADIVARMTARDAEARPATAGEVLALLRG